MFQYIRFYLKNPDTGELQVKYICKTCGKEMDEPKNYTVDVKGNVADPFTGRYQCDECYIKN